MYILVLYQVTYLHPTTCQCATNEAVLIKGTTVFHDQMGHPPLMIMIMTMIRNRSKLQGISWGEGVDRGDRDAEDEGHARRYRSCLTR